MGGTPPIPFIDNSSWAAPTQASATAVPVNPTGQSNGLEQIMIRAGLGGNTALPQQVIRASQPLAPVHPVQMREAPQWQQQGPSKRGSAGEASAARVNSIGGILALAGKFAAAADNKKKESLQNDISKVMQAQQNIANAQTILQNDPDNADAKAVLENNKKSLDGILGDDKKRKQIEKAFDLSFTDPEKNKTPEVQAGQAAMKQVKEAGAYNANNPAEAKIAEQAKNPQSYGDQFLGKQQQSLQTNPNYAPALAQQQQHEKMITQYVLPKLIQSEAAQMITAAKENGANYRTEYAAQARYQEALTKGQFAKDVEQMKDKAAMARVVERSKAQLKNIGATYSAKYKLAEKLASNPVTAHMTGKLKATAEADLDKQIGQIVSANKSIGDQMLTEKNPEQLAALKAQRDLNNLELTAVQELRLQHRGSDVANQPFDPKGVSNVNDQYAGADESDATVEGLLGLGLQDPDDEN